MNVILRDINYKDIEFMKEYYEDKDIKNQFKFTQKDYSVKSLRNFVELAKNGDDVHFAIDFNNEYAGTISLKNINKVNQNAEYAIVLRKKFWGTNVASDATKAILKYGFNKLNLNKIYLNVISDNVRANKFYEKFKFNYEGIFKKHIKINDKYYDINWYAIFKEDMEETL
jgi:diamine N-acetyltransferase